MLLVILGVVQVVLLAVLVILFLTKGRSGLQNSVPEVLTGLADLHASAERLEGKDFWRYAHFAGRRPHMFETSPAGSRCGSTILA